MGKKRVMVPVEQVDLSTVTYEQDGIKGNWFSNSFEFLEQFKFDKLGYYTHVC